MQASTGRLVRDLAAGFVLALTLGCQGPTASSPGSTDGSGGTTGSPGTPSTEVTISPYVLTDTLSPLPQEGETLALTLKGPDTVTISWAISSSDPFATPAATFYNTEKSRKFPAGSYTYKVTLTTAAGVVRESATGEVQIKVGMWKFEVRLGPVPEPQFSAPSTGWTIATSTALSSVRFDWWKDGDGNLLFGSDNATDAESLKYTLAYDVYDAAGDKKNRSPVTFVSSVTPQQLRDHEGPWTLTAASNAGYTLENGDRLEFRLQIVDGDNKYAFFSTSVTMAKDTVAPVETLAGSWFWEPKYALGVTDGVTDWIGFPLPKDNFQTADHLSYVLKLYDGSLAAPSYATVLADSLTSSIPVTVKSVTRQNGSLAWVAEVSTGSLPASTTRWAYLVAQDADGNRAVVGKAPRAVTFSAGHRGGFAQ